MKLLCIDGNSILNRAFYAIKLLTTKDGRYTNAIHGFMNILLKLTEGYTPDAVAIAFDVREKTFRHKMYDGYKATRKGMPQELASQMEPLKALLSALGYRIVTCPGFEADDILGTFAAKSREAGAQCYIATGDRDSLQLVCENATVLLTTTHFGKGETAEMTPDAVREKYGVDPCALIDVKALMGDTSDNIPGVAGVGEKTATALIAQFGSLDGVYANIDAPSIKEGVRKKLLADKDNAYLSRTLGTIVTDAPVETDLSLYIPTAGDPEAAAQLLGELEMHSLAARLGLDGAAVPQKAAEEKQELAPLEIAEMPREVPEGRLYLVQRQVGWFCLWDNKAALLDKTSLAAVLRAKNEKYVFDAKSLWHTAMDLGAKPCNIVFDLKLAAYLLSPASSGYEPERLAAEYGILPAYAAEDTVLASFRPLCEALEKELEAQGMRPLHDDIELPLSGVLAQMEKVGFAADKNGIRAFGEELETYVQREQQAVFSLVGKTFNLNSPKQLGEALFETLGLPAGRRTKSGYSTDAETLEKLKGAHPVIRHILDYRTYQKLNSTYVQGLLKAIDPTGRIHTEFKQTETRTGRISSREPNLQNIPVRTELGGRFRKYFVAKEGYTLVDADYSQIELRVLASLSEDKKMIDAFVEERDIHTETASEIFGLPRTMVTPELRRRAKAVNFGIVYGIGAFSLSEDVGVSVKEAQKYIDNYLATYAGVARYLESTVEKAKEDGFVTTAYGRRRALPELASSNRNLQALGKRLAMNTPIQGTAADIIKLAMIRVRDRLEKEGLDARLVLQVHDELIIECRKEDEAAARQLLKEEMEGAANLAAALTVDVGVGETWYEAKQ